MRGLGDINTGWGSCSSCIGTTYIDGAGNATGNGSAYVATPGVVVGSNAGASCSISGWLIAAAVGVVLLVSSKGGR